MDVLIFLLSFVAAFVFSLGGVGAAIVLIPILVFMGIPAEIARPVGLFYNTVSMAGASLNNLKNGRLDVRIGLPIIISSFIFAVLGAYVSSYLPERFILLLFIGFLLFSGITFLVHKKGCCDGFRDDAPFVRLALIGAFAGLLSGMLGVGGGGVISPLMLMSGFNPKKTAAVTAFVVPFSSFSGFLTYWAMGSIDWHITLIASIGGVIGATLGTAFMHRNLKPQAVKRILGVILLLMAAKLALKVI